ncbi:TetR/AcrR family transcriptional regulator [Pelagibacterium halotolerans]|uniref:TetR/AcrR family transcriptional regulator n=1 Tax=Pelagibacterium halotolerans TaxID=531813 RepID=UPI00384FFEA1
MPALTIEKKSGYHHKDLRQALLMAALALTVERKSPSFSLRELAAKLGVSHSAAYRHFPDKASLLDALATEGFRKLTDYQLTAMSKAGDDPLAQLYALGTAYVRFAQENEGFFVLMFSPDLPPAGTGSDRVVEDDKAFGNLTAAIVRCQEAGIVMKADPEKLASYLVLSAHGLASYAAQGRAGRFATDYERDDFPARVARLTLTPLLTKPPAPREIAALVQG